MEPAQRQARLPVAGYGHPVLLDQRRRLRPIPAGERVLYRIGDPPMLGVPGSGAAVQRRHCFRSRAPCKAAARHVTKQMMIWEGEALTGIGERDEAPAAGSPGAPAELPVSPHNWRRY
jgi:hypothetical protein